MKVMRKVRPIKLLGKREARWTVSGKVKTLMINDFINNR